MAVVVNAFHSGLLPHPPALQACDTHRHFRDGGLIPLICRLQVFATIGVDGIYQRWQNGKDPRTWNSDTWSEVQQQEFKLYEDICCQIGNSWLMRVTGKIGYLHAYNLAATELDDDEINDEGDESSFKQTRPKFGVGTKAFSLDSGRSSQEREQYLSFLNHVVVKRTKKGKWDTW